MTAVSLAYDDNGASGAPPFVFVHGWTCDRSFFAPQYEHFGRNHRAVALDLRGHGKSPVAQDGDYSVDAFVGDIAALIESLAVEPVVVVGHSLGGVITCGLAAARPDLVAAAVMVDPAPLVIGDALRPVLEAVFGALTGPDGLAGRDAIVDGLFIPSDDADRRAEIVKTMASVPHEIAAPAIGSLMTFDGSAALASVRCPIACINADAPINDVASMKATNPSVVIGQTLGAGHFNQLLVPDQVNAMIEQFLKVSL